MGVGKRRLILLFVVVLAVVMVRLPTAEAETGSEWLDCDAFDATYDEWTKTGADPYLDAQDEPTNLVTTKLDTYSVGWFDFPSTTLTGALTVNVSIYCKNDDGAENDMVTVYADFVAGSGINIGVVAQHDTYSYDTLTVTGCDTATEVNALRFYFVMNKVTAADDVFIDHVRIGVSGTVGGGEYTAYPDGSFSLAGDTSLIADFVKTLIEGFSLVGSTSLVAGFVKTLVEGFTLTGATSIFVIIQKLISEGFALTGVTSLAVSYSVLLVAGFALAGVVAKVVDYTVKLSVGFSLGGTVALAVAYVKTLIEGFSLAGAISAFKVFIVNLQESFAVGVGTNITKIVGTAVAASMIHLLFFSLEMWGYLGPMAIIIGGYIIMIKDKNLGVVWFVVECLIMAQYFALLEETPDYWWHIFILLIGSLSTIIYSLGGRKR